MIHEYILWHLYDEKLYDSCLKCCDMYLNNKKNSNKDRNWLKIALIYADTLYNLKRYNEAKVWYTKIESINNNNDNTILNRILRMFGLCIPILKTLKE